MLLAPEHLFLQFCSLPNGNFPFPSSPPFVLTWNSVRKNATWPNMYGLKGTCFMLWAKKRMWSWPHNSHGQLRTFRMGTQVSPTSVATIWALPFWQVPDLSSSNYWLPQWARLFSLECDTKCRICLVSLCPRCPKQNWLDPFHLSSS